MTATAVTTSTPVVTISNGSGNFPVGVHTITYSVTDTAGNPKTAIQTVTVNDGEFPVINLIGENPLNIPVGTTFNDPGATATDNIDGTLTVNTGGDTVITSVVGGPFDITYSATDSAGNTAAINRTVNVVDITGPIVTAPGTITIEATGTTTTVALENNAFGLEPLTASAADNVDANVVPVPDRVEEDGTITFSNNEADFPLGTFTVVWKAIDTAGNPGEANQTIIVQDTEPPNILLGEINNETTPVDIEVGTTFNDPGATATDIVDNVLSVTVSGDTVDTSVVGNTFTITYTATDNSGNTTQVDRVVNIVSPPDNTPPVITLVGANPQTITVGSSYVELGATATDDVDGIITNIIINPANVNTAAIGTYSVTYNVSDAAGNPAITQTRTVNVVAADTTPPTCSASPITVTATGNLTPVTLSPPTATDNVEVTLIDNNAPLAGFPIGVSNVIWTVHDAAGNFGTCNQAVTVESQSNNDSRIVIYSLPFIAETAGSYVFAGNLTHTTTDPGSCITVNADNVTIDLNGFSLIGSGQTAGCECHGISTGGKSNIKILNGTISDFAGNGIYDLSPNTNGVNIKNITTASNGGHGIFLNGKSHTISQSVAFNNLTGGIFVQNSSKVLTNTVYDNTGVGIATENGATILTNTVYNNSGPGITTINGSTLTQNNVYENTGNGIVTNDGCTLLSNTVYENTGDGIVCNNGSTLSNNTVHNNTGTGIVSIIAGKVKGNTCYLNGNSGISVGSGSMVSDNIVNGNNTSNVATQGGIFVSGNATLKCNQVTSNSIQNILVTGNGNVLQDNTVNQSDIGINFNGSGFHFFSGNKASGNTTSGFSGTALPTGSGDAGDNVDF